LRVEIDEVLVLQPQQQTFIDLHALTLDPASAGPGGDFRSFRAQ
jgi:hypothetical protein